MGRQGITKNPPQLTMPRAIARTLIQQMEVPNQTLLFC